MSTKTSIKRIALVAVSALGFGLMSVVPAKAADAEVAAGTVTALNATKATANTYVANTAQTVFVGTTTAVEAAPGAGNNLTITYRAALTTFPAGGFVAVVPSAAGTLDVANDGTDAVVNDSLVYTLAANVATVAETVASTGTNGMAAFGVTPTVAGDYVMTIWHDRDGGSDIDLTEARQTVSFTITAAAAAAALSQAYSTVYVEQSNVNGADADATTDAAGISVSKTAVAANAGLLTIAAKNTSNADITTVTVAATITGAGLLALNNGGALTDNTSVTNSCSANGVGQRVIPATAGDALNTIIVCADGTAGTGSISVTITDTVSGATATFTKTVTFYGAVASYTAVAKKIITGASAPANGATTAAAVEVKAFDAAGVLVPSATAYLVSSDTTKIATGAAVTTSSAAQAAAGTATLGITVVNSATADRYGNVTLTIQPSSTVTTPSVSVVVTLSKVAADAYTITTDKASYSVGEKMTFTLTRTESGRIPATAGADQAGALSWSANRSYTGTMGTTVAANATGVDTWSIYAPTTPGAFELTGTIAATGSFGSALHATTWTKSFSITPDEASSAASSAAEAAGDAALEAIDAANAATDAANLAAEAADAATVAAEEARDAADAATAAVEALAAEVATMIDSLKAQLTTLAKVVAKIAKKVKA